MVVLQILGCLLGSLLVFIVFQECSRNKTSVPGPRYLFGIGPWMTYFRFMWMGIPEAATYYVKTYGDFCRVWLQGESTYLTTRPSVAYYVMKTNGNNYCNRFGDPVGLKNLGMFKNGIIWNGNVQGWRKLRNEFFQKALNADTLNKAAMASVNATYRLMAMIPELRKRTVDGRIEVLDFLRRITLDVTNRLTLKVDIQNDEDLVARIVQYFKAWEYFLIRSPVLYNGNFKEHKKSVADLNESIKDLVDRKRQTMTKFNYSLDDTNCDFTEHLIRAEQTLQVQYSEGALAFRRRKTLAKYLKRGIVRNGTVRGDIVQENVTQCVLEMLLAGTDTSSVTMYYLLVSLAEKPEIQEKVVDEIARVIGDRDVTKADTVKLLYMEQALKESMRIKPVGPVVLRRALRDDVIEGHVIPANTNIILNLAQMHRREEHFPNADVFDPDHFADKQFQEEFLPFGTGPKGCIGQFLAMIEMKAILCTLLREYKVKSCGQTIASMATRWDIAQQPTEPSYLFLVPRRHLVEIGCSTKLSN